MFLTPHLSQIFAKLKLFLQSQWIRLLKAELTLLGTSLQQVFVGYNAERPWHCKPFVHDFVVPPFEEIAHLGFPGQYCCDEFPGDLLLRLLEVRRVPLLQPQLALPAEQQHELQLQRR